MKAKKKSWVKEVTVGRISVTIRRRKAYKAKGDVQRKFRYIVEDWSSGQRKQKTDLYTEEEATEEATRIANLLSTGSVQAAQMSQDDAMELIRSRKTLQPYGLTVGAISEWAGMALKKVGDIHKLNEALNFYSTHFRTITNKSVEKVIEELLLRKKKSLGERGYASLRQRISRFAKSFVCDIGAITAPQVQAWLDKQNFEAPRTYHNYRQSLNQLFKWAWKQKHAMSNIIDDVERAELEDGDIGIYSPEEMAKLITACAGDKELKSFLPCLLIGGFAGLRSAEIERLDWASVHWHENEFFLHKKITKTGYTRTVPIQDNLLSWLADYKDSKGMVWKGTHDGYYEMQQAIAAKAKVEWVHNGLRHSYGSYRYRILKGNTQQLSAEMGNSRAMVEKHYKKLVEESQAKSYFAIAPERPDNVVKTSFSKAVSA